MAAGECSTLEVDGSVIVRGRCVAHAATLGVDGEEISRPVG